MLSAAELRTAEQLSLSAEPCLLQWEMSGEQELSELRERLWLQLQLLSGLSELPELQELSERVRELSELRAELLKVFQRDHLPM